MLLSDSVCKTLWCDLGHAFRVRLQLAASAYDLTKAPPTKKKKKHNQHVINIKLYIWKKKKNCPTMGSLKCDNILCPDHLLPIDGNGGDLVITVKEISSNISHAC